MAGPALALTALQGVTSAVGSIFGLLQRTVDAGSQELLLIAAQEELVAPSRSFTVEAIGPVR